jgi:hypothetical protein
MKGTPLLPLKNGPQTGLMSGLEKWLLRRPEAVSGRPAAPSPSFVGICTGLGANPWGLAPLCGNFSDGS